MFSRPLLCHFWSKFGAVRPPKSLGQKIFFPASFELFCRIFGHLVTMSMDSFGIVNIPPGGEYDKLIYFELYYSKNYFPILADFLGNFYAASCAFSLVDFVAFSLPILAILCY